MRYIWFIFILLTTVAFGQQVAEEHEVGSPVANLLKGTDHGRQLVGPPFSSSRQLVLDSAQSHVRAGYPGGQFDQIHLRIGIIVAKIIRRLYDTRDTRDTRDILVGLVGLVGLAGLAGLAGLVNIG